MTLLPRDCPVCGASVASGVPFLERNIDEDQITTFSYSSRKNPEYMCYKLLRCTQCDVVYACESPDQAHIKEAYHQAEYDSKNEAVDAAKSYERVLLPYFSTLTDRSAALEIGTGTGIFLQILKQNGFLKVMGIEPSRAAIEAAESEIRPAIREGIFTPSDFPSESFSFICCFMTLEHVTDPLTLMKGCFHLIKPGGMMAVVVHDWRAWNNRILGAHAPIIDIEHLQLFSEKSVRKLFASVGFADIECQSFWNRYRVDYWNRLMPFPSAVKGGLATLMQKTGLGRVYLPMNVGNKIVVGRKKNP